MATIEKRPSGKWRALIRRKNFVTRSRTFPNKREAADWAAQIEGKILDGELPELGEARRTTLGEALKRYGREITPMKRGARQEVERIGLWLKDPLTGRKLASIRTTDIAGWRDAHAHLAPSTIRNMLGLVRQVFKVAASEWGMGGLRNPVHGVRLPRHRPGRDRRLQGDEEQRLLAAAEQVCPWLGPAIVLALETSMRRGELLSLKRSDIKGNVATLAQSKNGRGRGVPLSSRALAVLSGLPVALDGRIIPLSPAELHWRWGRCCATAGVAAGLRWHDLRHEAVSRLFERGLSTEQVMLVSGHRTYAMLQRYTHLRMADLVAKLG